MLLNNIDVEPRLFARLLRGVFSARICGGEFVAPKRPTNAMEGPEGGCVSDTNRGFVAEAPELRFEREISARSQIPRLMSGGIRAQAGRPARRIEDVEDECGPKRVAAARRRDPRPGRPRR